MLEAALITLMVMAGAALISYFTAVLMTDYTRQGSTENCTEISHG